MINDEFGDRMKQYERCQSTQLPERTPIIMRLDGRAFHTFTRKGRFSRPFDENLHRAMQMAAAALCSDIQNTRLAYTQSDEISILIYPKNTLSQPWLGNKVQKMVSVAAGVATAHFGVWIRNYIEDGQFPSFDARVFTLPVSEIPNYFWWRQADAIRNSVSMLARHHFSHRELHKKNVSQMKQMLHEDKSISWDEQKGWAKQGSVIVKQPILGSERSRWRSMDAPNFKETNFLSDFMSEPTFDG